MSPGTPIARLTPIYTTVGPDEPVRLHQGRLGIRQGNYSGEGDGALDLVWTSRPNLRFDIPSLTPIGFVQPANCTLTIPSLNTEAPAHISDARHTQREEGQSAGACGQLDGNVVIGSESPAHYVIFHVVNFWGYLNPRPENAPPEYDVGRVVFEGGGWRVTLESVSNLRELHTCLRHDSGCGITHVGRAEKLDGSTFSQEDAHQLFNALYSFLSFARGMWSPPILYVGMDGGGTPVWENWTVRQASPWRDVLTWFPEHQPHCLAGTFPGFMRLWLDPDRRDILEVAIHWYIEANLGSGAIEGAVILCQNGLERLAYYIMVHEQRILREQDFRSGGLPAAERLRRFFTQFGLPIAIGPPRLRVNNLPDLAAAQGWRDAPEALVTLRNSIVHPDQRNMQRLHNYPIPARIEAWTLCLWYLELVLLKWLGYSGNYVNRQTIRFNGETEPMP
jgi:hypothetical protein